MDRTFFYTLRFSILFQLICTDLRLLLSLLPCIHIIFLYRFIIRYVDSAYHAAKSGPHW